jgi:hypothetical protein
MDLGQRELGFDKDKIMDLQGASARPAFPEPRNGQKKPGQE